MEIRRFFDVETKKEKLSDFLVYLNNKVVLIFISSASKEDAFKMFTILNNRGVPLRGSDILKAINIEAIQSERQRERYSEKWEHLEEKFGKDFDKFLGFVKSIILKDNVQKVDFLKSFETEVYRENKDEIPLIRKGVETIDCFEEYKNIYEAVLELEDENLSNEYKNLLTIMKMGMNSEHWIPPLLAYYKRFKVDRIIDFLRLLERKYFSDWLLNVYATVKKENMNKILKEVLKAESLELLLNNELLFTVDHLEFGKYLNQDFDTKNTALVKYILLRYEYVTSENVVHFASYEKRITVEHVLPRNPSSDSQWLKDFDDVERKYWTNKIANLVLLSRNKNSALSNKDFEDKKRLYFLKKYDSFNGSKIFLSEERWTKELLERRQHELITKISNG